ncbi:hypothetical protein FHG87_000952 [Trinorchestia longiramus]|nr:hypothetical protein FHG87_000952 [Trinorchestia longiramus]
MCIYYHLPSLCIKKFKKMTPFQSHHTDNITFFGWRPALVVLCGGSFAVFHDLLRVTLLYTSVSQSGPYHPPGGVEKIQGGGRRVHHEWGAYITV